LALALDQLAMGRVRMENVVIITDGGANVGRGRLPGLLNRARAAHVHIFTIGVGNNAVPDYDRGLLAKIASDTRARFASADRFRQLCQALSRSRCEPFRLIILAKLEQGLSAQRIWQDLVSEHGYDGRYWSVRRFVAKVVCAVKPAKGAGLDARDWEPVGGLTPAPGKG
jgi:hypothetical protein